MKKILFVLLGVVISLPCFAETMAVQAVTDISTENPKEIVKVRVIRDCKLDDIDLKEGYILEGKIISVAAPKRLKQDASFTFSPVVWYDNSGKVTHFPKQYIGEFTPKFEINPAKVAKSAILSIGNHFVKGISAGFYAVEGAVHNEKGNRAASAVENVYENSFFSYVEKGEQLHLKPDTCFGLKFDACVNENESNIVDTTKKSE